MVQAALLIPTRVENIDIWLSSAQIIILNSQKLTNASLKPFWTCKTPILVHFWIAQRYAQELSYQTCCSERWTIVPAVCKVTFLNSHKCTFPGLNTFATDKITTCHLILPNFESNWWKLFSACIHTVEWCVNVLSRFQRYRIYSYNFVIKTKLLTKPQRVATLSSIFSVHKELFEAECQDEVEEERLIVGQDLPDGVFTFERLVTTRKQKRRTVSARDAD